MKDISVFELSSFIFKGCYRMKEKRRKKKHILCLPNKRSQRDSCHCLFRMKKKISEKKPSSTEKKEQFLKIIVGFKSLTISKLVFFFKK